MNFEKNLHIFAENVEKYVENLTPRANFYFACLAGPIFLPLELLVDKNGYDFRVYRQKIERSVVSDFLVSSISSRRKLLKKMILRISPHFSTFLHILGTFWRSVYCDIGIVGVR